MRLSKADTILKKIFRHIYIYESETTLPLQKEARILQFTKDESLYLRLESTNHRTIGEIIKALQICKRSTPTASLSLYACKTYYSNTSISISTQILNEISSLFF